MKTTIIQYIKVVFVAICILISTLKIGAAQDSNFRFEQILFPGGDLANFVTSASQDSLGFMWFSTWNGIYRYDGYSFTNYTHDPKDTTSISANWVETLYVDRHGTLWAGTYGGGLNRFNHDTETFTRYRHNPNGLNSLSQDSITVITEDHLGQLWVGTMGGLNLMNRETGNFTRYEYDQDDSTSLSNNQVRAIFEDKQGTIWIGTNSPFGGDERNNPGPGGLNRFNRDSETFTRYLHDPNDPNSLASNYVMSLFEDSRGTFWIGTWNHGLVKMEREKEIFTRYFYDPSEPIQLITPISNPQTELLGGVRFINEDHDGYLWFGIFGGGLSRYDPETGNIDFFDQSSNDPTTLSTDGLWNMYQSTDGTYWISMIPGGLNKFSLASSSFEHHTLTPMHSNNFLAVLHVDRSGILRTHSCCPERTTISFKHDGSENSRFEPFQTYRDIGNIDISNLTIEQLRDGQIWVGTYEGAATSQFGGLYRINPQTNQITPIFTDSTDDGKRIGPIAAIHNDRDGSIWLGTKYTGLFRLNSEIGETIQYTPDPEIPSSISHESVITIHESDSEPGILWIGTEGGGLNRLDIEEGTFTQYQNEPKNPHSLNGEYITSIYSHSSDRIFIGTRKSGLNIFDKESGQFTHFTQYNSGLPDNNIACLLGDEQGDVWLGTSRGLARFEPDTQLFYTYTQKHGVKAQPFIESCDIDPDGRLIFGGTNGFTVFHPKEIETNISTAPIVFTDFLLRGEPVDPDLNGALQSPIWQTDEIRLSHTDNSFSIEFAVLDFRDSESNQYLYQLEGYDPGWQNAGLQRNASYSQVPFGEYNFRVQAANSEGVWNQQIASIPVTILPPWWRTWWAYGAYAILFIAGIFTVDRFQRRRLISKERERARERELEQEKKYSKQLQGAYSELEDSLNKLTAAQDQLVQQEKLASLGQLTAGIAHEIKNPLNFVNNFSELSVELVEEAREEVLSEKAKVKSEKGKSPFPKGIPTGEEGKGGEAGQGDDTESGNDSNLSTILEILNDIEANLCKIHEHGSRADSIVKSMLQHSRGGDGKMEPTDLNALVKEYVNLSFHGMRAGKEPINVDIDLQLDESVGDVPLIAEDFSRVILNLTNNAFDAMREKEKLTGDGGPETGEKSLRQPAEGSDPESFRGNQGDDSMHDYHPKLTVKTQKTGTTITIEIEDNGPGIPEEMKDKILQPFFTTKKGTQGTGLGLSITNDIVKAHGGALNVSTQAGKGTTFNIELPK